MTTMQTSTPSTKQLLKGVQKNVSVGPLIGSTAQVPAKPNIGSLAENDTKTTIKEFLKQEKKETPTPSIISSKSSETTENHRPVSSPKPSKSKPFQRSYFESFLIYFNILLSLCIFMTLCFLISVIIERNPQLASYLHDQVDVALQFLSVYVHYIQESPYYHEAVQLNDKYFPIIQNFILKLLTRV